MNLILASSNSHKAEELNEMFSKESISISAAPEKIEVVEDGDTFAENSYKKAAGYFKRFKKPTIADDSGLIITILPDELGVQSARFAPELPEYKDKCNLIIEKLANSSDRSAYFICNICVYFSEDEYFHFEGRMQGEISHTISGSGGFGYDPIFIPDGKSPKTIAELDEWKAQNSHRARAVKMALNFLRERNCQSR